MEELAFESPVTFLVGENGSGKSTLLEGIAASVNSITIGGESIGRDPTLSHARELAKRLKLIWNRRTHKGFFLRAEDFFRFTRKMSEMNREMAETAEEFEGKFSGYGLMLAKGAVLGQKAQITSRYGEDLNANSHGESFLKLFQARFVPDGLYLLDEPEVPLSPLRRLSLLSLLKEMVSEKNSQFIIATHSPILMAFPESTILLFEEGTIRKVDYDELEHVRITRDFLNNPESFLRHL
jgi:predicted ATPase